LASLSGASIYVSKLLGAMYDHIPFDDGDVIPLGAIYLHALNTPGHSPDSICVIVRENEIEKAIFTGDTLFIGDFGRPNLRENIGNITAAREELAKQMYHSLHEKIAELHNDTQVLPTHGAGSLCGKNLSTELSSTIGKEKQSNIAMQPKSLTAFVQELISDQPFVPKYFEQSVTLNKKGIGSAATILNSLVVDSIHCAGCTRRIDKAILIIDTRKQVDFRKSHFSNSYNIMDGTKFETWLGSIVNPGEKFYLLAYTEEDAKRLAIRCSKIGYESQIYGLLTTTYGEQSLPDCNLIDFDTDNKKYIKLDVRNTNEVNQGKIFTDAICIPLHQLRERLYEIPTHKPIMIHCAAGYRSAAALSILSQAGIKDVYDLGDCIVEYSKKLMQ